ncbi:unnamed protein product [Thelazia callipaeda]|uniref:Uncharacterized protein n=1 Tax=Thelazia callipaeda TaxID=103827 RepID=A0A0N5D614_THECL|nr:unnamed protein product [Thelazia callipaeda]
MTSAPFSSLIARKASRKTSRTRLVNSTTSWGDSTATITSILPTVINSAPSLLSSPTSPSSFVATGEAVHQEASSVPVKVSREIGIRFPNLPGFSSSTVRREASQPTTTSGAISAIQSSANTASAAVAPSSATASAAST